MGGDGDTVPGFARGAGHRRHVWPPGDPDEGSLGQVLVLGTISRDTPFPSFSAFKRFMRVHGVGMVEELYDVGRRALNVNAALMDLDFGVEVTSPEVPMDFVDALQETVVEQDPLPVTE